jgi:hypothetical protein
MWDDLLRWNGAVGFKLLANLKSVVSGEVLPDDYLESCAVAYLRCQLSFDIFRVPWKVVGLEFRVSWV